MSDENTSKPETLHELGVAILDRHVQGCTTTAMLGCEACILWLHLKAKELPSQLAAKLDQKSGQYKSFGWRGRR